MVMSSWRAEEVGSLTKELLNEVAAPTKDGMEDRLRIL